MEEKKEITPENLLEDLKYFQNNIKSVKEKRLFILELDLYIEYFIHKLYERKLAKLKDENEIKIDGIKDLSVKKKAIYLVVLKVIDKMYLESILLIYDLRCELVHTLIPDIKKVENVIDKFPIERFINEKTGLVSKFFKDTDPWNKIPLYIIPTVMHLYNQLKEINGERIDYSLIFRITPDATKLYPELKKE